jgi:BirA family biotin operon repressor/biotin-[acetyl-CoA-carboxylase] ligase
VGSALQAEIPDASMCVKPPNDVLINGRKVCGILIESPSGAAPAKDRLIIGIGINVNNTWLQAPPQAGEQGESLFDITGRLHETPVLLSRVVNEIERRLNCAAGVEIG